MNDDFFKRIFVTQEFLADPEQILVALTRKGFARADARMNEKEIPAGEGERQRGEKLTVALRQGAPQFFSEFDALLLARD